jgi:hypothetical protein
MPDIYRTNQAAITQNNPINANSIKQIPINAEQSDNQAICREIQKNSPSRFAPGRDIYYILGI